MPEDPSDELRLIKAPGVWRTGEESGLTLQAEMRRAMQGVGHIQLSLKSAPWVDVESTPDMDGSSPFPFSSQNRDTPLQVTPQAPGRAKLRIKIEGQYLDNGESATLFTNEVSAKILGVGGGVIE